MNPRTSLNVVAKGRKEKKKLLSLLGIELCFSSMSLVTVLTKPSQLVPFVLELSVKATMT